MGSPISGESPFERIRRTFIGVAPSAGADWSVTVPGGVVWRVLSILASLTSSATAGTRAVNLTVSDGKTVFVDAAPAGTQAISLTYKYAWWKEAGGLAVGTTVCQPIPPLDLPAGFVIASSTANISATDQWTAPVLYVVEAKTKQGPIEIDMLPDMVVELVTGQGS